MTYLINMYNRQVFIYLPTFVLPVTCDGEVTKVIDLI